MKQNIAIVISLVLVLLLFVFGGKIAGSNAGGEGSASANVDRLPRELCVNHDSTISMHIHPELTIFVDDESVPIPANIGIDEACMRALHTHDATGEIHIEYPETHDFTLGDFFANWGQSFSATQLFEHVADEEFGLRMTVDGKESSEFENLVLTDGQKIVIYFEAM